MTYIRYELNGPFHVLSLNVQKHVGKLYFLSTDGKSEGQYKNQNKMKAITRTIHCGFWLPVIHYTWVSAWSEGKASSGHWFVFFLVLGDEAIQSLLSHNTYKVISIFLNTKIKERASLVGFWDRVSLCVPDSHGTCYVDQASLKLTELWLTLPPKCWD